ncbi:U3 small nucleolar ribonucleoprotein IMP4 [Porphyridium purpureum]|uniref:U3 small nucleolar ribonucleoprotein IMP4 n=1 Tax=Porphyridium purpureum TaxID=35688 RepID=A0A5J4YYJ8_PORPP|nr:U3 small nucleolar ribonucleoprotein IMP4 [Porphyridium purpureum]|eukprot:POR2945..scf209_3
MLRRQVRERREYLYRKSLEGKQREEYEKRKAIRDALAAGKKIPTELRQEEAQLRAADGFADAVHDKPQSHVDDEYGRVGEYTPRVIVTTSRDASSRLQQFVKELRLVFPESQRINRGNMVMGELIEMCRRSEYTDVVIVHETRGEPDSLIVSHLPFGPTAYFNLSNVVMRHDIPKEQLGKVSEAIPHLIFENMDQTKLGLRVKNILRALFPPIKNANSKRVMTFANQDDFISFRHHVFQSTVKHATKLADIELKEVGPRFEMRPYQIKLGTLEQVEADDEWVLRPHMNTAKKRKVLG